MAYRRRARDPFSRDRDREFEDPDTHDRSGGERDQRERSRRERDQHGRDRNERGGEEHRARTHGRDPRQRWGSEPSRREEWRRRDESLREREDQWNREVGDARRRWEQDEDHVREHWARTDERDSRTHDDWSAQRRAGEYGGPRGRMRPRRDSGGGSRERESDEEGRGFGDEDVDPYGGSYREPEEPFGRRRHTQSWEGRSGSGLVSPYGRDLDREVSGGRNYGQWGGDASGRESTAPRGFGREGYYERLGGSATTRIDRAGDREWRAWGAGRWAEGAEVEARRQDRGRFAGIGPKGYRRSDDRIRDEIYEMLTRDPYVDASDVEIRIENGEAVIEGVVGSREEKRRVENLAEAIRGVDDVTNRLKVRRDDQGQQSSQGPQESRGQQQSQRPQESQGQQQSQRPQESRGQQQSRQQPGHKGQDGTEAERDRKA